MGFRYMFINATKSNVTIHVYAQERVQVCELVDSTPVEKPEQVKWNSPAAEFDLTIPSGSIYGFSSAHSASYKDPGIAGFEARTTNGTVPWPEPPPSQNALNPCKDFKARYRCFLDPTRGTGAAPSPLSVARSSLARATSTADDTNAKLDEIIGLLREVLGWLAARGRHPSEGSDEEEETTADA